MQSCNQLKRASKTLLFFDQSDKSPDSGLAADDSVTTRAVNVSDVLCSRLTKAWLTADWPPSLALLFFRASTELWNLGIIFLFPLEIPLHLRSLRETYRLTYVRTDGRTHYVTTKFSRLHGLPYFLKYGCSAVLLPATSILLELSLFAAKAMFWFCVNQSDYGKSYTQFWL